MPIEVRQIGFPGFAALGETWRGLEPSAAPSFFQSWTWVGCLAEERFPDPVLLEARRGGRLVGLALYNRRRGRLCLGESGDAELDRPFVEHNGPLAADAEAAAALLRAAWDVPRARRLVLGGVPPAFAADAGGVPVRQDRREAPFLDLAALRAGQGDLMACISANARYQIRRSDRHYAGSGALDVAVAETPAQREAWMGELMSLHDATWRRRGQAGAFATDFLRRFHLALTERAMARGELDLVRVMGAAGIVGLLYNLRHRQQVHAYQSGFADPGGHAHARPGLTCHARAIVLALARGDVAYDFLAGDQRYKRTFASGSRPLVWLELARPYSAAAALGRLKAWARRGKPAGKTL